MSVWKRASTPQEKRRFLNELEVQWSMPPDMRLGQLIFNAVSHWLVANGHPAADRDIARSIFYAEEEDLMLMISEFIRDKYPPTASTFSA